MHPWFTLRLALLMGFYVKNKKKYKGKFKDIRDYLPLMKDKKEEGTWSEFLKDFVKSHTGQLLSTPSARDSLILLYLNRKYIIKKLLSRDTSEIENFFTTSGEALKSNTLILKSMYESSLTNVQNWAETFFRRFTAYSDRDAKTILDNHEVIEKLRAQVAKSNDTIFNIKLINQENIHNLQSCNRESANFQDLVRRIYGQNREILGDLMQAKNTITNMYNSGALTTTPTMADGTEQPFIKKEYNLIGMPGSLKEDENLVFHPKELPIENIQTKPEVVKKKWYQ